MKQIVSWLAVVALIIQVCACIAIGLEIFVATHLNPNIVIIEACFMGVGLIVEIVCVLYRAYLNRQ